MFSQYAKLGELIIHGQYNVMYSENIQSGGRPLRKICVVGLRPFNIQTKGIALDFRPLDPVTNIESWPDGLLTQDAST